MSITKNMFKIRLEKQNVKARILPITDSTVVTTTSKAHHKVLE